MTRSRTGALKKRKKRQRDRERRLPLAARSPSSDAAFRWAARVTAGLGLVLVAAAIGGSYLFPAQNRILGPHGNVSMRLAGVALVIASFLFGRRQK